MKINFIGVITARNGENTDFLSCVWAFLREQKYLPRPLKRKNTYF